MKKITALLTALALILGLCACSQSATTTWQEQYDLGVRYLSEGNYREAIIAFNAAIEIDPKQADAYVGLADAYEARGDLERARQVLENALAVVNDTDVIQNRLDRLEESTVPEPTPGTTAKPTQEPTPGTTVGPTPTDFSDIFDSLISYAWDSSYQTIEYTFFFQNGVGIHYNAAFPGTVPYENYFSYEIKDNSVILTYSEWFGTEYDGTKTWVWDDDIESLIYTFEEYGDISTQTITSLPVEKVFYDWTNIDDYSWIINEQDNSDYWKNLMEIMLTYYNMTLNSQEYTLLLDEQSTWESKLMRDMSDLGVDSNTVAGAKWINVRMKNRMYDLLLLLPGIDSYDIPSKLPENGYVE